MIIKRIFSTILRDVDIDIEECDCFLHDYNFLGIDAKHVKSELEGKRAIVYTADFKRSLVVNKCPWCKEHIRGDYDEHFRSHAKSLKLYKVLKFQQELYKEKLRLLRAGKIDHTYFVYTNFLCQMCDDRRMRGRGICSIPESARNKTRSINVLDLKASTFPSFMRDVDNIGYLIGDPL